MSPEEKAEKRRKAETWVNGYTSTAMGTVLGSPWLPGASNAILATLEATMCYQIGRIYKVNYSMGEATAAAGVIGVASFVGKLAAIEASIYTRVIGRGAKPVIAGGIVKSRGQLVIKHFEDCPEPGG